MDEFASMKMQYKIFFCNYSEFTVMVLEDKKPNNLQNL